LEFSTLKSFFTFLPLQQRGEGNQPFLIGKRLKKCLTNGFCQNLMKLYLVYLEGVLEPGKKFWDLHSKAREIYPVCTGQKFWR
jgi:hypothetical protein